MRVAIMGGLEETLRDFRKQVAPLALAFFIISDSEEEKQVENKVTKTEEQVEQLVEIERLATFSSELVEGGFFDVQASFLDVPITILTKSWSKYMMRHKGEEQVEEGNSPTKVTRKRALAEAKEIQKMLKWI